MGFKKVSGSKNSDMHSLLRVNHLEEIHFFSWYLIDYSKKNLEHCGTYHVQSKHVGLFRTLFKSTKVAIVSHVKFNF